MTGLVRVQQQSPSVQLRQQETQRLVTQLARLRELRFDEKRLRARVAFLERQAAGQGPLHREVDLALALEQQKSDLETLRTEIVRDESLLEGAENLPAEQAAQLKVERLSERISDLKAKREQATLHQQNVHFLEERLAEAGHDGRLDLANELKACEQELAGVQGEISGLMAVLFTEWKLGPSDIPNLDTMSEKQIAAFAEEVILRRENLSRESAAEKILEATKRLDTWVRPLLTTLRDSAFPKGAVRSPAIAGTIGSEAVSLSRSDGGPNLSVTATRQAHPEPEWELHRQIAWEITVLGDFSGVAVIACFDPRGNFCKFQCRLRGYSEKDVKEAEAEPTEESLRSVLAGLVRIRKQWWEFWRADRRVPRQWL